ncbi:hypothetical protein BTR23_13760 [Alkalihalophilus pseudofirmus]|nr:hypothetical protein BTR23_13760 [Alkalihalophilus pseudofirmus]
MPAISLIMPVYNGERFLRDSIKSILNQSFNDFELIIINDGSHDRTEEIIQSFNDPRICYVKQENKGKSNARNHGIKKSQGEFVIFHDADDLSLPNRLQLMHEHMTEQQLDVVHSDMLLINEKGHPLGYWSTANLHPSQYLRFFLKVGTPFNNGSMMFRKNLLKNQVQDEDLVIGEDTEFIERIIGKNISTHIPHPLLHYRRHASNESQKIDEEKLTVHVRKILSRYSLQELVPECNWDNENELENICRAYTLLFLHMLRRGLSTEAQYYLQKARESKATPTAKQFMIAIVYLATGNPAKALTQFNMLSNDHIIHHYKGECCALLNRPEDAYNHFTEALRLAPDYEEPLHHLKALGCSIHFHSIDPSYYLYN